MLTPPTKDELAIFTGRPVDSFSAFADEALSQASLMFSIVTGLQAYPDDQDLEQLARNAIMELADRLLLEQPYAELVTRPFQSETIGSYNYSRSTATTAKIQNGQKTGLFWWDLALDQLTVPGVTVAASGSIKSAIDGVVYTNEGMFVPDPSTLVQPPPYVRIS